MIRLLSRTLALQPWMSRCYRLIYHKALCGKDLKHLAVLTNRACSSDDFDENKHLYSAIMCLRFWPYVCRTVQDGCRLLGVSATIRS